MGTFGGRVAGRHCDSGHHGGPAGYHHPCTYLYDRWLGVSDGVLEVVDSVRLRKHISGEWLLALGGAASIIFGILIAIASLAGALVIALWFGAYAFVFGAILVVLGFRRRSWRDTQPFGPPIAIHSH